MTQTTWPFPDPSTSVRVTTDPQYEQMLAAYTYDGLNGQPGGASVIYGDSSGMQVKILAGQSGYLRGHFWASDATATDTVSIASNTSGSTRVDLVVLQLDRSTWKALVAVHAGTPGSGAPTPTRTIGSSGVYELPLAEVTVLNGAATISAAQVVNRAWYLGRNGWILCTSTSRPPSSPMREIWEADTTRTYRGIGSGAWQLTGEDTGPLVQTVYADWNLTVAGASGAAFVRRKNGVLYVQGLDVARRKVTSQGDWLLMTLRTDCQDTVIHKMTGTLTGADAANLTVYPSTSSTRAGQVWLINAPPLGVGDFLHLPDTSWPLN